MKSSSAWSCQISWISDSCRAFWIERLIRLYFDISCQTRICVELCRICTLYWKKGWNKKAVTHNIFCFRHGIKKASKLQWLAYQRLSIHIICQVWEDLKFSTGAAGKVKTADFWYQNIAQDKRIEYFFNFCFLLNSYSAFIFLTTRLFLKLL